jgi:hypothetical protein
MSAPTIQEVERHVESVLKVYRRSRPNDARTFCVVVHALAAFDGISKHTAFTIARDHFPGSHRAFVLSQEAGTAPKLFPKPDYAKRLARAVATGGRIG